MESGDCIIMKYRPKILVVGSFVMDLIVSTHRFPEQGETVLGDGFQTAAGGKGANQAIQAARLNAETSMVGRVGNDAFGKELIHSCEKNGVECSHVVIDREKPSSVGNVQLRVDEDGKTQNRIIVVPGANMAITPEDIRFLQTEIDRYDMVLLQLEIPMEINELAAEYACAKGVPVMLNSAPSDRISRQLLSRLTFISPNEYEAADLTGVTIRRNGNEVDLDDVREAVNRLLEMGVENVLITLGSAGAAFGNCKEFFMVPALSGVTPVDPTGAGDSFVGAFSAFVSMGINTKTAVQISNYVGALTVSAMGAQPSLPSLEEVAALIRERGEEDLLSVVEDLLNHGETVSKGGQSS